MPDPAQELNTQYLKGRKAWRAAARGITKNQTGLSDRTTTATLSM